MTIHLKLFAGHKLSELKRRIEQADDITSALMWEVIEATCGPPTEDRSGRTTVIWRLVRAGAYVDAVLALIATVLPGWCVRRICHDDGQWWCAMNARQPVYWEADAVDESHRDMALAILKAFVSALVQVRLRPRWLAPRAVVHELRVLGKAHDA